MKVRIFVETWKSGIRSDSALARLEAALNLVDHVNPALAADQAVVTVATT